MKSQRRIIIHLNSFAFVFQYVPAFQIDKQKADLLQLLSNNNTKTNVAKLNNWKSRESESKIKFDLSDSSSGILLLCITFIYFRYYINSEFLSSVF